MSDPSQGKTAKEKRISKDSQRGKKFLLEVEAPLWSTYWLHSTKIQKLFSFLSSSHEAKQRIRFLILKLNVAKQLIHTETFAAGTMANIHENDPTNVELLN